MSASIPTVQYGYLTHDFPRHEHDCWEIHLFTGGAGELIQDGTRWSVGPATLVLSPPGSLHSLSVKEPLSFYYLQFLGDRETLPPLQRLLARQSQAGVVRVDSGSVSEVGRLKERLDSPSPDRVASGLHGFRSWLYDLVAGRLEPESDRIAQVQVWMSQNLGKRLSLDALAGAAGLDRFAFSRRFKSRTGLSPLAYFHRSKVEAAGFLLSGTELSLAEVAQRLGFCDEFHFGKVFRKWRDVSPGRWRREHR